MIAIGVDPGLSGAIAFCKDGIMMRVEDMPVQAKGGGAAKVKHEINPAQLKHLIRECVPPDDHCLMVMESVAAMPAQGVSTMFSLGDTFGCIRGVAGAMGIPIIIITPRAWKGWYLLRSPTSMPKQERQGHLKELSRAKAIALWPTSAPMLARKKDHNRAEAMLIAQYGWKECA